MTEGDRLDQMGPNKLMLWAQPIFIGPTPLDHLMAQLPHGPVLQLALCHFWKMGTLFLRLQRFVLAPI